VTEAEPMRVSESSTNVERAAVVLQALGDVGIDGISLKDLVTRTGEPKTALHRTLVALTRHGFVEQIEGGRNYRLGPAIYALSRRQSAASEKVRLWRPTLMALGEQLSCTMFLMERMGLDGVVLDMHIGSLPVPVLAEGPGRRLPLGYGPGTIAILSQQDTAEREAILLANEKQYRDRGIDPAMIRYRVDEAVECGFARSVGDIFPGYGGVAVPIRNRNNSTDTAITASTLEQRLSDDVVEQIAGNIAAAIHAVAPPPEATCNEMP
jgi:DNA-binding IclR family transcriptional regulator